MRNAKMPLTGKGHFLHHKGAANFLKYPWRRILHEIFLCLLRLYVFVWLTLSGERREIGSAASPLRSPFL